MRPLRPRVRHQNRVASAPSQIRLPEAPLDGVGFACDRSPTLGPCPAMDPGACCHNHGCRGVGPTGPPCIMRLRSCLVLTSLLPWLAGCPHDHVGTQETGTDSDGGTAWTSFGASSTGDASSSTSTGTTSSPHTDTGTDTDTPPNEPPPTPELLSPTDGALDVSTEVELCWEPVDDPDGDDVRYKVFVDDIELDEGKLGELPGHEGPCIGPLNFNEAQTFRWTVQAFEAKDETRASDKAEAFLFTTETLSPGVVILEETFEDDDGGWSTEGDALQGSWTYGNPIATEDGEALAQPGTCGGGQYCWYTGENPRAIVDEADVAGGSTALVSPPFDLTGHAKASVRLRRFFYKSADEADTGLRVELLVPDANAPGGYEVFELERLEAAGQVAGANLWTPVEYAACDAPMSADSRLRITATDVGTGITEAAIDSVAVVGYRDAAICESGAGAMCDPSATDPCEAGYLCCPQGTINAGIHRCKLPVNALDWDDPTAPGEPFDGPLGCDGPDLSVMGDGVTPCRDQILVVNDPESKYYCALLEGCVNDTGVRDIIRFDTITPNLGSRHLTMGVPSNHPELFHFSECHSHYHFDGYATYDLVDGKDSSVASGHKQAFCLLDWASWAWPQVRDGNYTCSNQGISVGWQDTYGDHLDCQWIDVTDVAEGSYTLRIAVNPVAEESSVAPVVERDYTNNVLELPLDLATLPTCD